MQKFGIKERIRNNCQPKVNIKQHLFDYDKFTDMYFCDVCGAWLMINGGHMLFAYYIDSVFQDDILSCGENIIKHVLE
jgi:hypothetical protein